jgi:hypothetical protein
MRRLLAVMFAAIVLSGCVLQSAKPLIAESGGELLLDGIGTRFASYTRHGSAWDREEETLSFKPAGRHYVGSDGKSSITVTFAKLAGGKWVMQAVEPGALPTYALTQKDGNEIYLMPIACKPLQEAPGFAELVEFKDEDCFAREGVDATKLFDAVAALPFERVLKIVPLS